MSQTTTGAYEPGIYVKGDDRRVARTRSAAVALAFEGFRLETTEGVDEQDSPTAPTATMNTASLFDPSEEDDSE